ncbi:hypothetical protein QYF61_024864 [Mycteria americana]|uniref:Uncharacterized protein n=1 Tax=Mycteria americana TaxID=33587 RepID=A0AAN7S4J5_MYCAM|nr:hypothetical protein QYF61_024864 [Mycteria americana]
MGLLVSFLTGYSDRPLHTSAHCRHHLTLGQQHHASVSGSLCGKKREKVRSCLPGPGEVPAGKREPRGLPASPALWLVPSAAVQSGPDPMWLQPAPPPPHRPALLSGCSVSLRWSSRQQPFPTRSCFRPPSETSSLFPEEKFPNIQSKPPLVQLEAISSCPITCYQGEETDPHHSTTSFQVVVESNKVSPQPPFLQAKQPQFPQPLLIRLVLQTLTSFVALLWTRSGTSMGPKLNTVFEVQPHQYRVQGDNHFPSPAGHTISDTSQDAIGFLGHLGTLLAHIQLAVNQPPQVLFHQAAFQPLFPKPVALHGLVVTQVQDPALSLVEPHTIGLGPSIQPLQSLPTLKQINTAAQLGVICKLTEGALDPFVQIIDKDIKQLAPTQSPGEPHL